MPVDRERQRTIAEAVAWIKDRMAEPSDGNNAPFDQAENLSEVLALLIAFARANGHDEALAVEIVVRAIDSDCEQIGEAASIMAALGYSKITPVLRRLAKRVRPRSPTFAERMRVGFKQRVGLA
jgi:hypothetical protein